MENIVGLFIVSDYEGKTANTRVKLLIFKFFYYILDKSRYLDIILRYRRQSDGICRGSIMLPWSNVV